MGALAGGVLFLHLLQCCVFSFVFPLAARLYIRRLAAGFCLQWRGRQFRFDWRALGASTTDKSAGSCTSEVMPRHASISAFKSTFAETRVACPTSFWPVYGELALRSSHSKIALRSYVFPSA